MSAAELIGLVAVTAAGRAAAVELAAAWPGRTRDYSGPAAAALPRAFAECTGIVAFVPTGVAVRTLAPHLAGKRRDPGVVCVDESRRYAVALLGGHAGGANALSHRVAEVLGAEPVVTTGSDVTGLPGLDALGWPVEGAVAAVGRAVLDGLPVRLVADATWPLPPLPPNVVDHDRDDDPHDDDPHDDDPHDDDPHDDDNQDGADDQGDVARAGGDAGGGIPTLRITDRVAGEPLGDRTAVLRPPSLVVGAGASTGVSAAEVLALVDTALAGAGLSPLSVRHLATVDRKAGEPGLVEAAGRRGWPLVTYPAARLAAITVPNPSEVVRAEVGTPSVAEAAARAAPGGRPGELVVPKRKSARATVAVARHRPRGRLAVVGIGPGARDLLAPRAVAEIRRAGVIVGLDQYVAQVADLVRPGARVLASPIGQEERRARTAVERARCGHAVALLGSGDAGVYALAGPALDVAGDDIDVVVVPGVTAALAAAALLGAPLGHDHVAVSLSDLHTPWPAIEARVRAAAAADLVVTFYNPRSRGRRWQLPAALDVLRPYRPLTTPVGVVADASRPGERVTLTTLRELDPTEVDMSCVVVVGGSTTRVVAGRMITPRGYPWTRS